LEGLTAAGDILRFLSEKLEQLKGDVPQLKPIKTG
jgi:hypothetical protein